jgi:hypothetical protein
VVRANERLLLLQSQAGPEPGSGNGFQSQSKGRNPVPYQVPFESDHLLSIPEVQPARLQYPVLALLERERETHKRIH